MHACYKSAVIKTINPSNVHVFFKYSKLPGGVYNLHPLISQVSDMVIKLKLTPMLLLDKR